LSYIWRSDSSSMSVPKTAVLAVIVGLDLFAVSLVVPLLPIRYKELGVQPVMIGFIGSIYSAAQIVGGLVFGIVGDRLPDRRYVLLISFAGAALSYSLVGLASEVWVLAVSRAVVGLVKQTMTASKAMTLQWSDETTRASALGLISSAMTVAWVTGSAVTGHVRSISLSAPSVLAVGLYAVCTALVLFVLPPTPPDSVPDKPVAAAKATPPPPREGFFAKAKRVFGTKAIGNFLALKVLYQLVLRAGGSMQVQWEMDRFNMDVGKLGYLSTGKALLSVTFNALLAGRAIRYFGEQAAFRLGLAAAVLGAAAEAAVIGEADVWAYALLCVPAKLLAGLLAGLALEASMARLVPKSELGTSLSVLDVLSSACGVVAPVLAGAAMQWGGLPTVPLLAAAGHAAVLALSFVALPSSLPAGDGAKKKE